MVREKPSKRNAKSTARTLATELSNNCLSKDYQVVDACIAPKTPINAHDEKRCHLHKHKNRQCAQKEFPGRASRECAKHDGVGAPIGQDDQYDIEQDLEHASFI